MLTCQSIGRHVAMCLGCSGRKNKFYYRYITNAAEYFLLQVTTIFFLPTTLSLPLRLLLQKYFITVCFKVFPHEKSQGNGAFHQEAHST